MVCIDTGFALMNKIGAFGNSLFTNSHYRVSFNVILVFKTENPEYAYLESKLN